MDMTITAETIQLIQWLEPRKDVDSALRQVLENEIRRRLATYEFTDRMFQRKYGMMLTEFEVAGVVKDHGYSYKVESDHQEWDQAVDGIATLRDVLQRLEKQQ